MNDLSSESLTGVANRETVRNTLPWGKFQKCQRRKLTRIAFFFRIQQFGETRVFLQEIEVFIIARVITVSGTQIDGNFQIGQGRIGFAGKAIKSGKGVMNVIRFGRELTGFLKTLASFVPPAQIHHGNATLIMVFGTSRILVSGRLHALFRDAQMGTRAVSQFLAGAGDNALKFLLGALKFLLMEKAHRLFVEFHLGLHERVNHFNSTALRRWRG